MKLKRVLSVSACTAILILFASLTSAENIDPNDDGSQYAYGENVGWLNFEPNHGPGVTVSDTNLTGYVWAENIGWINLDPNDSDPNSGVKNNDQGQLSGYAWSENTGWINFKPQVSGDPNHYGVAIDHDGNFHGWAWGENIGWINFNSALLFDQGVRVCKVAFDDLANFVNYWLDNGTNPADLDGEADDVDFEDYGIFSGYWRDYCPDGWLLK